MQLALDEARRAADLGEVPVGAVITDGKGVVIARAGNRTITDRDPTAHAEILAIRSAARLLDNERLTGCDLFVTLEPCAMCAGAISSARIARLYFGASDEKMGGVEHGGKFFGQPTCHHRPDVFSGLEAECSADLLRDFFKDRRAQSRFPGRT